MSPSRWTIIIILELSTVEVMRLTAVSKSLSSMAPGESPTVGGSGRMVKRMKVLPSLTSSWVRIKTAVKGSVVN